MIQVLKKRSLQKFYDKNIRKQVNVPQLNSKIKTIGVLCPSEVYSEVAAELKKIVDFNSNNFTFLQFSKVLKKEGNDSNVFSPKEFGFSGKIISETIQNFINTEFDLLLNYTTEANLYTNIVTLQSKAIFKVGFSGIDDALFNLVISEPAYDRTVYHQELEKYLRILNKI